ncbi:MAG: hypothetical protein H5T43_07560 [Methanomethylovorans sp.]|nr:hypothetical protein [Methanomethylovorans sp.]
MTSKYWITFIGSSPFAVINTVWAACKEGYVPDSLMLFVNEELSETSINTVRQWLPIVLVEYGIKEPSIRTLNVNETGFHEIKDFYGSCISSFKEKGEIAVDITPGRKYMSAIAMAAGISENANHVYYLHLKDSLYQDKPLSLIPAHKCQLIDLKKEFEHTGKQ